jgi:molybdenum cofactor cytidylyltransferase
MKLSQAIRLSNSACLALTGAGGKTAALFQLARELAAGESPVLVTATTHLHIDQIKLADVHWIAEKREDLEGFERNLHGVVLVTGPKEGDRTVGVSPGVAAWLHAFHKQYRLPLLIEADGSRRRPLKAPAEYEPVIPDYIDMVVVVAGMTGLGKPLTGDFVHRPEIFALLSGLNTGDNITTEALARVLIHPSGGLKNIPPGAQRVALLNQSDTPVLQAQAKTIAAQLLPSYESVVAASLNPVPALPGETPSIHAVYERVAGIVLAGGESARFGEPKQLLDWQGRPFVHAVAETALNAGLSPVLVVTGAHADRVENALHNLDVGIEYNPDWQAGQSSSIQAGLRSLAVTTGLRFLSGNKRSMNSWEGVGAAIFLLADQPQVTPPILRALVEQHTRTMGSVIAPLVDGKRANPVLFDRITFPELMELSGDVGGRAVFSKFPVEYLTWHDQSLLADVDTVDDYRKLNNRQ